MRDLEGIRQIGEIINSHGNKGELKVVPLTDDTDLFLRCQSVILLVGEQRRLFDVIKAKPVKNTWIVQLAGISNIESAKKLKKIGIYVREDQLKPLAEDEFFIDDLLHTKVYTTEGEFLGTITNYFEVGSHGVCEVTDNNESFLFPTTQEVLKIIEPAKKVVIQLIPGLRELNRK